MTDLRRIRIDNHGLLTQSGNGKLERIPLDRTEVRALTDDTPRALRELQESRPVLGQFFDADGQLAARLDVACEPAHCLTRPLRVYYNIEPDCNLKCSFCGPRDLHDMSKQASAEQEEFLLTQIADAGTFQVQLTGGEIFIRGRKLFATLERTAELGLATLLGTNGVWTHIPDRDAFLRELATFGHIIEVKVSVDGTKEFHDSVRGAGTYDEAVKTLMALCESGVPTRINTTIFKESCTREQIEHVARLAKRTNAGLQAIPERSCGRSGGKKAYELPAKDDLLAYTQHATRLRDDLGIALSFNFDILGGGRTLPNYDPGRPFSCGAGLWGFAVSHTGKVYPCGFAMDIGEPPAFLAGAISEQTSLLDIWLRSSVLRDWRHAGKSIECNACRHYHHTCWGGCMIQAYVVNGKLNAPDPYCIRPADHAR